MAELTGPDFSKNELIPAIAQDSATGDVLMMAWMNKESYEETLRTGRVCYYSRSRKKLWRKGEESGNVQELHAIYFDSALVSSARSTPQLSCLPLRETECLILMRSTKSKRSSRKPLANKSSALIRAPRFSNSFDDEG